MVLLAIRYDGFSNLVSEAAQTNINLMADSSSTVCILCGHSTEVYHQAYLRANVVTSFKKYEHFHLQLNNSFMQS